MIFESELATAWEEMGTEGMQFLSFMVVLFIFHPRPIMIQEEMAFNCFFKRAEQICMCECVTAMGQDACLGNRTSRDARPGQTDACRGVG